MTTDLLTRLSVATGPSRNLEAEIALANGWTQVHHTDGTLRYWLSPTRRVCAHPPRYTESIDAAMTLVPKNVYWLIGCGKTRPDEPMYGAQLHNGNPCETVDIIAEAESDATPAIALVIACLKTRMEKDNADK